MDALKIRVGWNLSYDNFNKIFIEKNAQEFCLNFLVVKMNLFDVKMGNSLMHVKMIHN